MNRIERSRVGLGRQKGAEKETRGWASFGPFIKSKWSHSGPGQLRRIKEAGS